MVATSEVRAPGGPFIIALGAGSRRAGDLVTQLASKSGATVSIVLIDPAIGGASHDLSNESVVSNLINLAARQDCVAVIASPPCQSFQMPMTDVQQVYRNVHHPDGIMINARPMTSPRRRTPSSPTASRLWPARPCTMRGSTSRARSPWRKPPPTRSVAMGTTRRSGTPPHGASSVRVCCHRGRPSRLVRH